MGRVTTISSQSPVTTAPLPINHFTHPHPLHPTPTGKIPPNTLCSGCKLQPNTTMYSCQPCSFILHQSCAKLPKQITHPCHIGCTLSLLTVSSYPGGVFSCDACAHTGNGWSYHCKICDYDLHVTCASKPLKIRHQSHPTCELALTFQNPYPNTNGFSCDICSASGSNQWLYRCNSCEFDVHLNCKDTVMINPPQPTLQHNRSLPPPARTQFHHNQLMHSASTVSNYPHAFPYSANRQFSGPVNGSGHGQHGYVPANQPFMMPGAGMGHTPMINQTPASSGGLGSSLMNSAMQGLVEGAFQGVGQSLVQSDNDGGGGGIDELSIFN